MCIYLPDQALFKVFLFGDVFFSRKVNSRDFSRKAVELALIRIVLRSEGKKESVCGVFA